MRLFALLGTWLGLSIMVIAIWPLSFVDGLAHDDTFLDFTADAAVFDVSAMTLWFSDWGYLLTLAAAFALGSFAAVGPSRLGRIVGAVGYGCLAALMITNLATAWSEVVSDPWDIRLVVLPGLTALLSLIGAVCSALGKSHWVALPAMLFTVAGVVCSLILMADIDQDPRLTLYRTAWALPVGYLITTLALLGSFLAGTRLGPDGDGLRE